jgi:hypothetical protein
MGAAFSRREHPAKRQKTNDDRSHSSDASIAIKDVLVLTIMELGPLEFKEALEVIRFSERKSLKDELLFVKNRKPLQIEIDCGIKIYSLDRFQESTWRSKETNHGNEDMNRIKYRVNFRLFLISCCEIRTTFMSAAASSHCTRIC